jgi:hypothetical protein
MSERRTRNAMDDVISFAEGEISEEDEIDIEEVFTELMSVGGVGEVQSLEEPIIYAENREDILKNGGLQTAYGVDSSTFERACEFVGGTKMNIGNAVIGRRNGNRELTTHRSIVAAIYKESEQPIYETKNVTDKDYSTNNLTSKVKADVMKIPEPSEGGVTSWVSKAALKFSFGKHLARYVDEMDGGIFLDGPLYPIGVIHNSVYPFAQLLTAYNELLQNYALSIENQILSGYPIFGVVKTFKTNEVTDSMRKKAVWKSDKDEEPINVPWKNDYTLMSALLRNENHKQQFTHTSWMTRPHPRQIENMQVYPFENMGLENLEPKNDLYRAFFFVRVPNGEVFRIETPVCLVRDKNERDAIKQYALWEIANTKKVPQPIDNADTDAGLTRELRDDLLDKLETETETDYNKDTRWPSRDHTGDT